MSVMIPNEFTSYSFTEKEQLEGAIFSVLQEQVLQNQLSMLAVQKNNLAFNPANQQEFVQEEAYLRGQIDNLKFILSSSDAAREVLYPTDTVTLDQ